MISDVQGVETVIKGINDLELIMLEAIKSDNASGKSILSAMITPAVDMLDKQLQDAFEAGETGEQENDVFVHKLIALRGLMKLAFETTNQG